MTSKFKNRVKQILYRPAKKHPNLEFISKKLGEAEKTLDSVVGGVFGSKTKKKDKKDDKKDNKKE